VKREGQLRIQKKRISKGHGTNQLLRRTEGNLRTLKERKPVRALTYCQAKRGETSKDTE
jgi:hypothetical protein